MRTLLAVSWADRPTIGRPSPRPIAGQRLLRREEQAPHEDYTHTMDADTEPSEEQPHAAAGTFLAAIEAE